MLQESWITDYSGKIKDQYHTTLKGYWEFVSNAKKLTKLDQKKKMNKQKLLKKKVHVKLKIEQI